MRSGVLSFSDGRNGNWSSGGFRGQWAVSGVFGNNTFNGGGSSGDQSSRGGGGTFVFFTRSDGNNGGGVVENGGGFVVRSRSDSGDGSNSGDSRKLHF